jgi:hypothetical protein
VKKLGRRVVSLHLKDVNPALGGDRFHQLVEPGAGCLGFPRLWPRINGLTDAIGYVEVDNPADDWSARRTPPRTWAATWPRVSPRAPFCAQSNSKNRSSGFVKGAAAGVQRSFGNAPAGHPVL